MQCPKCHIDMMVHYRGVFCENDDTPDKATEVYSVQTFTCRNPQCSNYERMVDTVKTKLN